MPSLRISINYKEVKRENVGRLMDRDFPDLNKKCTFVFKNMFLYAGFLVLRLSRICGFSSVHLHRNIMGTGQHVLIRGFFFYAAALCPGQTVKHEHWQVPPWPVTKGNFCQRAQLETTSLGNTLKYLHFVQFRLVVNVENMFKWLWRCEGEDKDDPVRRAVNVMTSTIPHLTVQAWSHCHQANSVRICR